MYFWRWWTFVVLIVVAAIAAQINYDIIGFILKNDPTHITVGIITLFSISSLYVGYLNYLKQFKHHYPEEHTTNPMWFIADTLMSIGMMGTFIGFLIVLTSAFGGIDTADTEQIKEVISTLASGMGVALLTSLAGLATSTALKAQLLILSPSGD